MNILSFLAGNNGYFIKSSDKDTETVQFTDVDGNIIPSQITAEQYEALPGIQSTSEGDKADYPAVIRSLIGI